MSIDITLRLDESSLQPFRQALAEKATANTGAARRRIAAEALARYRSLNAQAVPDYVRRGLARIPDLAALLVRDNWPLADTDTACLAGALAYFCNPEGLIPDDNPRFGLIDDVIVIEIALNDCRHDWLAWREYRQFVARHPEIDGLGRDEWLTERQRLIEEATHRGEPDSYLEPPLEDPFHRESHSYLENETKPPFAVH